MPETFRLSRPTPWPTVDVVVETDGKIVLIRRGVPPFEGERNLPGGFVEWGETVEDAAVRETREETGLDVELLGIIGVYSGPSRGDPRGSTISTAFAARVVGGEMRGGDDAKDPEWASLRDAEGMLKTFDHAQMVRDYMRWKSDREARWSTRK